MYNLVFANELKYIREKHYHFDPSVLNVRNKDLYIHGWWQSEKYFLNIRDTLLNDFTLRRPLPSAQQSLANYIKSTNSVGVHIRRLDYMSNPKTRYFHGELPLSYYYNALDIITKDMPNPILFVFSDDIETVQHDFTFPQKTVYVEKSHDETGAEDMYLMSLCKHNIIANSSFSWWGAWLNRNPNKIVIAPTPWVAETNKQNSKDVVPETWVTVPANYIRS